MNSKIFINRKREHCFSPLELGACVLASSSLSLCLRFYSRMLYTSSRNIYDKQLCVHRLGNCVLDTFYYGYGTLSDSIL